MKSLGHTLCALLIMVFVSAAIATNADGQVRGEDFRFVFDGGISIPASTEQVRDAYAIGVGASGGVGVSVNQMTEILLRGSHTRYALKDGDPVNPLANPGLTIEAEDVMRGGGLDIRALSIELRRDLSRSARSVVPYIGGRMALTQVKANELDYRPAVGDDTWRFVTGESEVIDGRVGLVRVDESATTDDALRESTVLRLQESTEVIWGAGLDIGLKIPISFTSAFTISGGVEFGFAQDVIVTVPLRVGFHFGRH